jgi:hypothetical protein
MKRVVPHKKRRTVLRGGADDPFFVPDAVPVVPVVPGPGPGPDLPAPDVPGLDDAFDDGNGGQAVASLVDVLIFAVWIRGLQYVADKNLLIISMDLPTAVENAGYYFWVNLETRDFSDDAILAGKTLEPFEFCKLLRLLLQDNVLLGERVDVGAGVADVLRGALDQTCEAFHLDVDAVGPGDDVDDGNAIEIEIEGGRTKRGHVRLALRSKRPSHARSAAVRRPMKRSGLALVPPELRARVRSTAKHASTGKPPAKRSRSRSRSRSRGRGRAGHGA